MTDAKREIKKTVDQIVDLLAGMKSHETDPVIATIEKSKFKPSTG